MKGQTIQLGEGAAGEVWPVSSAGTACSSECAPLGRRTQLSGSLPPHLAGYIHEFGVQGQANASTKDWTEPMKRSKLYRLTSQTEFSLRCITSINRRPLLGPSLSQDDTSDGIVCNLVTIPHQEGRRTSGRTPSAQLLANHWSFPQPKLSASNEDSSPLSLPWATGDGCTYTSPRCHSALRALDSLPVC